MKKFTRCTAALAAAAGLLLARNAHAQQVVEHEEYTGPNTVMFRSGIGTMIVSYVPAVVVAGFSDVSADKRLYIPVAGPWLDFAERDCPNCRHETFNRVMLVTDGIFQGLGALDIVGSFFVHEEATYVATPEFKPLVARRPERPLSLASLRIGVTPLGRNGYGMAALGKF